MCGSSSSPGSPSEIPASTPYTAQPQLVYQNGQWVPGTATGATNPAGGAVPQQSPTQFGNPQTILAGMAKGMQAPSGIQPQTMAGQGSMPVTPAGQPGGGNNNALAPLIRALLARGA